MPPQPTIVTFQRSSCTPSVTGWTGGFVLVLNTAREENRFGVKMSMHVATLRVPRVAQENPVRDNFHLFYLSYDVIFF